MAANKKSKKRTPRKRPLHPKLQHSVPRVRMRSPARQLEEMQRQKMAVELKIRGATRRQIAEHLNVSEKTVDSIIARALDEYAESRDAMIQKEIMLQKARVDAAFRVWVPKAFGGKVRQKVVDPVNGTETEREVHVDPDPQAMKIVLEAQRDMAKLLGAHRETVSVEHSGAGGGPIVTHAVDAMEAARLVREAFGPAAAKPPVVSTDDDEADEPGEPG